MPGMKGDEFLVKAHQRFPKVVKILLTGHAAAEAIDNARRNAALHRCLWKPWQPEELREAIDSGLAR
jgi:response regulator RpfG family c-di-GMP phosphodiesterase